MELAVRFWFLCHHTGFIQQSLWASYSLPSLTYRCPRAHCHKFTFVFHSIECKTSDKVFFVFTFRSFPPEPWDLVTLLALDVPSQPLLSFLSWHSDSLHFILRTSLASFRGALQWLHSSTQLWWCILEWS